MVRLERGYDEVTMGAIMITKPFFGCGGLFLLNSVALSIFSGTDITLLAAAGTRRERRAALRSRRPSSVSQVTDGEIDNALCRFSNEEHFKGQDAHAGETVTAALLHGAREFWMHGTAPPRSSRCLEAWWVGGYRHNLAPRDLLSMAVFPVLCASTSAQPPSCGPSPSSSWNDVDLVSTDSDVRASTSTKVGQRNDTLPLKSSWPRWGTPNLASAETKSE